MEFYPAVKKSKPLNPDVFTKSSSVEDMYNEVMTKCREDKMPPINFLLQYAPKKGAISGFFAKLFKGHSIDTGALLGFTSEVKKKKSMKFSYRHHSVGRRAQDLNVIFKFQKFLFPLSFPSTSKHKRILPN